VHAISHEIDRNIAHTLLDRWRRFLKNSMRHPTGTYERHMAVREARLTFTVTDGGMVYGPWLEGTSRRNRATRFKGYAAQRRARREVDRESVHIAERVISANIGRLE
ncbi:MAG TPA: hypothetical protein VKB53_01275, partial [Gammaproteobacteria bacterium]|nr:hypothetical protein [Gammaproteobacteria bacterium]